MTTIVTAAILERLARACRAAGLEVEMAEPAAGIRVSKAGAHPRAAEVITVKPGRDDEPCFWWSWNKPFCPADDIDAAVRKISGVVSIKNI